MWSRRLETVKLDSIDVGRLDIPARAVDVRRDIHVFVDYVRSRDVKRAHRDNMLSKADAKRLAKLMSDPEALQEVEEQGTSTWVDFVDSLVWELGFVTYDTKGEYAGYTSAEPSFPDNYIQFSEKAYAQFLAMPPAKQESTLLALLLNRDQGSNSEFYSATVLGRLDKFSTWGCGLGVVPLLDFDAARRFLLERLAECPPGQWLSTASLVEHLKQHHRYFLIPQKPRYKHQHDARAGRYQNFHEGKDSYGHEGRIAISDKDSFERVEGRYVERFLEHIPWILGYVDVAYRKRSPQTVYPSLGVLEAFRVSERLSRALRGKIEEPRVTVTPAFDVYVQAETYPVSVLTQLAPVCETVSEDTSFVLKMTKQKVAAARAADPKLDVVALLRRLSPTELPANVVRELSAWSEHGEKFVLYTKCSVLEADKDLAGLAPHTVETMAPGVLLVRSPDKLYAELERRELMPLRVEHGDHEFTPLPKNARTRFSKKAAAVEKVRPTKPPVTLMRVTRVQLVCPDRQFLDELLRALVESKCPIEANREKLTLSYSKANEPDVSNAIRSLKTQYQIKVEDAG
jgi:hypothetical protein